MATSRVGLTAAVRAAVIAYGASASMSALSLGLGEIEMQSFLNEPLRAEVELLDTRQLSVDDIRIRLAGVDDFDRLGVDRSYFLTSIEFEIDVDPASGRGVIRLSTAEAVLEPFLDLIIEARWPSGRLLREYTVLVDPPVFRQEVVTVSASERVEAANPEKPAIAPQPEPVQESTGDTVALRESSLPPGAMPQRAFSAETSDAPLAGNRYLVKRDETLWQIASEGKPDGISVQQAMLDIQRMNPEAFINGNINQIKAGYIIYLPAAGEISSDDLARALDEVREQNQEWQSGRAAPGVTAAATLRVSADSSPMARRSDSDTGDADNASAGSSRTPTPSDTGAASSALDAADATADAVPVGESAASSELAAQIDAMASRLDTLEQIVALKDEQIATLEQALREAREAAATAAAAPAAAPRSVPTPSPGAPAAAPQAQAGPAIPWLPIAGGVLVAVLGGVFFLRRRSRSEDVEDKDLRGRAAGADGDDDVFAGVSLKKDALAAPTDDTAEETVGGGEPATEAIEDALEEDLAAIAGAGLAGDPMDRGGSRGYGERKHDDYIDEGAASDALAEADIYIAYGRYLQAIELLNTAISNEPDNGAYRVKLIELYVDMGEEASAAEQMEELRQHGSPDAIARGEALLGGVSAPPPAPAIEPDLSDDADESYDFDAPLDLETPEESDAAEAPAAADDDLEDLQALDDLDEPETLQGFDAPETADEGIELTEGGAAEPEDSDDGDEWLDANEAEPLFSGALDGNDDDEPIEFAHLEIEEDTAPALADDDELDFSEAEDELDLSDAFMSDSPAGGSGDASADADAEEEELLIADDADQMATKLDLARAYIDMGDSEGARVILGEVTEKGTAEQQQEASELLSRID